jgi:hypothetical protein
LEIDSGDIENRQVLTEKISEFIDFHLRPFIANLPSHIKDTTDYLKKMENLTIAENTTLVTMDVTWLFSL